LSNAEVLARFADHPNDTATTALAALLERHGPMVLRGTNDGTLVFPQILAVSLVVEKS
jgi:hypothetical protein